MTARDAQTMTWDAENRLIQVADATGTLATFTYDGDGTRVTKTEGGETTHYVNRYYEKNVTTDEETFSYYHGGRLVAVKKGGTLEYVHQDHLGSTSVTTNGSGASTSARTYLPFGSERSSSGSDPTNRLYTGQRFDDPVDLYFYNARYYDQNIGRFISADSIVSNPTSSQGWNRYSYVQNNPLKYTDPSGNALAGIVAVPAICATGWGCAVLIIAGIVIIAAAAADDPGENVDDALDALDALKELAGGGTAQPPGPGNGGPEREKNTRDILAELFDQRWGGDDKAIRATFRIVGKVADFIGQHKDTGRYLIAESKGGNIGEAVDQLQNTANSFFDQVPGAANNTEFRIYTNRANYDKLRDSANNGLAGWQLRNGYLGWIEEETGQWYYQLIEGHHVQVFEDL